MGFVSWTMLAWAVTGHVELSKAIFATLAALVMGYPCALGMAKPLAMLRGGAMAAERGILMRSGEAFQVFGAIDTAVLDKTDTLTLGRPSVVEVVPASGVTADDLLGLAAATEIASEHPVARAVVTAATDRGLSVADSTGFITETGQGVRANVEGSEVSVGKPTWVLPGGLGTLAGRCEAMEAAAQTVMAVAADGKLQGLIAVADAIKPDATEAMARLEAVRIRPVMVTGDNEQTAKVVAEKVGIDALYAGALPNEKADFVRCLQARGHRVLMVGDGINDAPALTQAEIGIAMGAGTDIAIESADVVLVGGRLTAVTDARTLGVSSFRNTKQNLAVAFAFNGVEVPLAVAGVFGPTWAMAAMLTSVSFVLANSFATRLTSGLADKVIRFLGRSALASFGMLAPSGLRRWAAGPRVVSLIGLVAVAVGLGMLWVVALGAPAPGL